MNGTSMFADETMQQRWHRYASATAEISAPLALIDLDMLDANIDFALQESAGLPIRIGTKSIRSVEVLRYVMAKSDRFQGLMCFHPREALTLSALGFDDLLVAYPTVETAAIKEVAQAVRAGANIILMVDCESHARQLNEIAANHEVKLPVCVEVDVSLSLPGLNFGVFRSPIRQLGSLKNLVETLKTCSSLIVDGAMAYEAQLAGVPDDDPSQKAKSTLIKGLKNLSKNRVLRRRESAMEVFANAGIDLRFFNGGGTGSLSFTARDPSVNEVTVGSIFFAPHLFDHYQSFSLQPAASYALEIVRAPTETVRTCLGGGYPASGICDASRGPKVYLPEGLSLDSLEGAGEVQTPIHLSKNAPNLRIGDRVFLRHAKSGELCERFNTLQLLRGEHLEISVPTYRGDGYCFL